MTSSNKTEKISEYSVDGVRTPQSFKNLLKNRSVPTTEHYVEFLNISLKRLFGSNPKMELDDNNVGTIWESDFLESLGIRASLSNLGNFAANAGWNVQLVKKGGTKELALELRPNFIDEKGHFDSDIVHEKCTKF
jgi:hypothetical protein